MRFAVLIVPALCFGLKAQIQSTIPHLPPGPVQAGEASIEGTVIDAVTREPVKKASVMLNGRIHLIAVTDGSGHFAFRQLPAGPYLVVAQSDRYPQAQMSLDAPQQLSVSLGPAEEKQGVSLSLLPAGVIRGHIVDENGSPMFRCSVSAMQFHETDTGHVLQSHSFATSDEKGEYRLANLPRGKFYIQVRCNQTVPLPHALVHRDAELDLPALSYPPQFYPGTRDLTGATRVEVSPGADIAGMDLRMSPATGVTVRGHLSVVDRNVQISLAPRDPARRQLRQFGRVDPASGEFRVQNVLPGSYDLEALASTEGAVFFAKLPVEVGVTQPDRIELALAPAPTISGSVSMDDGSEILKNLSVMLNPLDGQLIVGPAPGAQVQSDGSFKIESVLPGRWRLNVGGPGYVKSVRQGDQEVVPESLEIGLAAAGPLKIVVGTKFAQVDASLIAPSPDAGPVSAVMWRPGGDPRMQQSFGLDAQGRGTVRLAPGRYYACAIATAQPWILMQNPAFRKELEGRCETVDAPEAGRASVQLPLIPVADLKRLIEKLDE